MCKCTASLRHCHSFDHSKTVPHEHDPNTIEGAALKIASFNVRVFGTKKMADPLVKDVLIKVKFLFTAIIIFNRHG